MSDQRTGKRVIIKIGTGVLTRESSGELHHAMFARLSQAIADPQQSGPRGRHGHFRSCRAGLSTLGLNARPDETKRSASLCRRWTGPAHASLRKPVQPPWTRDRPTSRPPTMISGTRTAAPMFLPLSRLCSHIGRLSPSSTKRLRIGL